MNTALILAGGRDPRFSMDIPKQFINVNNRPVIVYTLEIFQNHRRRVAGDDPGLREAV